MALYPVASCRYQSSGNEVNWTELKHSRLCSENEVPDIPSTRDTNLTKSSDVPEPDTSSHLFLWVTVIVLTILLLMCCGISAVVYFKRRPGSSAAPAGDTPVYDDIATVRYYDYIDL
jgi:hypothetical protein